MKLKKLFASAAAGVLVAVTFAANMPIISNDNYVNAESYSSDFYDESSELNFRKVDEDEDGNYDYITISELKNKKPRSVEIPSEIEKLPVTSIGDRAFFDCSSLTSITIPNSVTSIGASAFYHCTSLTDINIPDSVTSIGEGAFISCTSLTSITIPNSVKSIGKSAFSGCTSLTSITIPNSVTSIGDYAFSRCTSLTSITIPNSVTSIGDYAFDDCSNLTSITIPDSVTSIGSWAFGDCDSLTDITIPNSVTSIGCGAFGGCTSLTNITIPGSVTSIGWSAFSDCTSLTNITIENPECEIYDWESTISNGYDDDGDNYFNGTILGYTGSTAQEYAKKYGYKFESIGEYTPKMKAHSVIKAILNFITKKATNYNSERLGDPDLNSDGKLNVFDLIIMKRRLAKLYN